MQQQLSSSDILSQSPYLAAQLERHPDWLDAVRNSQPYATGELRAKIIAQTESLGTEAELLRQLRLIRNQEMCRIAWRDLSQIAPLNETFADTSELAGGLIDAALQWWYTELSKRHGTPLDKAGNAVQLSVIGMGKLGGGELNFSSDIDLIFAFSEEGETAGPRKLDHQTFFIRLGQKLITALHETTADGIAYRVDMRLRPFGDSGALALSFSAIEYYYQAHGREWERYALIKARPVAGNIEQGEALLHELRPFIYRRYLDYGAIEQLRDMKAMIDAEARRKHSLGDVKLGPGGIREIEFCAQVFQLMRGGHIPALQQRSLQTTLAKLSSLELLSATDTQKLQAAYAFLRRTENRIQMWKDQQAHTLPQDSEQQLQLAKSMQFESWSDFLTELNYHQQAVRQQFSAIFQGQDESAPAEISAQIWQGIADDAEAQSHLVNLGFADAPATMEQLHTLRVSRLYSKLTELSQQRVNHLIPRLIDACQQVESPDVALERALNLVQTIAGRSGYLSMLSSQPQALDQLIKLLHGSHWIATQLSQQPSLLDELLTPEQLYKPLYRDALQAELSNELKRVDSLDIESVMERLRYFKQAQVLRVAAVDVMKVLPLMRVSDQLSWIAESILECSFQVAWHMLVDKHGEPGYHTDNGDRQTAKFCIAAYGKLGGLELSYGSDLDIVFLHNSQGKQQQTNGNKSIPNEVFFARLAQRIVHILSTFTPSGRLYEIDTRLRPNGNSGLLVSSIASFEQYQLDSAWPWEHQALLRARAVAGDDTLMSDFEVLRHRIVQRPREPKALMEAVLLMREKMWSSYTHSQANGLHLKKDPGGITDIEFIVQYLVLAHAHQYPSLSTYSDNVRLLECLSQHQLISKADARELTAIYCAFRDKLHQQILQNGSSQTQDTEYLTYSEQVRSIWQKVFKTPAVTEVIEARGIR
jgi:glutamate-ammonia-ligase adenylyltransferase